MRIAFWPFVTIVSISALVPIAVGAADRPNMRVGGKIITLMPAAKCKRDPKDDAESLSKYLNQYDFKDEWELHNREAALRDEDFPEFAPKDQLLLSEGLVQDGFRLFNRDWSPIVWMDFDGDGRCDFSASVSGYGQYPILRVFLFRGMPDGTYSLVMADYRRDSNVELIPFIPVSVSGEKLPIILQLAGGYEFFLWNQEDKAFRVCRLPQYGSFFSPSTIRLPISKTTLPANQFSEICESMHDIGEWATSQISFKNEDSNSAHSAEILCKEHAEEVTRAKPGDARFDKAYKECRWWFDLK